jgi:hypothetical protein
MPAVRTGIANLYLAIDIDSNHDQLQIINTAVRTTTIGYRYHKDIMQGQQPYLEDPTEVSEQFT